MTSLHTLNRSPFESSALASCLRLASAGDALLLREDAVLAALVDTRAAAQFAEYPALKVYALKPCLAARGLLEKLAPGIELIDDDGFVALCVHHARVVAWS